MSAYGTPYVLKEALDEQVDTFFDKPIILSRFQESLQTYYVERAY